MKKVIIMFALAMGIVTANAQENVTVGTDNGSEQPTLTKEVYPQKEADGDLYRGLSRKLTFDSTNSPKFPLNAFTDKNRPNADFCRKI